MLILESSGEMIKPKESSIVNSREFKRIAKWQKLNHTRGLPISSVMFFKCQIFKYMSLQNTKEYYVLQDFAEEY